MITFLSWAIILGLSAYVAAAPDKRTMTASRGMWGAARGWANPEYAATKTAKATKAKAGKSKASKGKADRSGAAQGSRWDGMLAGWNAGVTVARQRRAEGRDLWSIGSRFVGRTWGGGESLVVGARRLKNDLAAWYRRQQYAADGPVVQGTVVDDEPAAKPTGEPDDFDRRPPPPDGPVFCTSCAEKLVAEGKPYPAKVAYLGLNLWAEDVCAGCGKTFGELHPEVFKLGDRYADAFYEEWVAEGRPINGQPTDDLAAEQAAEGAPAEGAGAPSSNASNTTPKEMHMGMLTTELANLDEVEAEVKQVQSAIEELVEALQEVKQWAGNLPERWEATEYSTKGLDVAIDNVPESFGVLTQSDEVLEQLDIVLAEIGKARAVGEAAAEVGATGRLEGFAA